MYGFTSTYVFKWQAGYRKSEINELGSILGYICADAKEYAKIVLKNRIVLMQSSSQPNFPALTSASNGQSLSVTFFALRSKKAAS
jgi:hypothetical protein